MKKFLLPLVTLSLSASIAANAATVANSGDWQLDDSVPNDPNKGICTASTAGYMGSVVVSLAVVIDKTGARPPEMMLQPTRPVGATAMYVQSNSGTTFYLAKLASANQYWNIPVNTERFINDLDNGNQITFYAVSGTNEQLPLSLTGSTAMIHALRARCTRNTVDVADFERRFLPDGADRFNIKAITPAKADALRAAVASAIPAYRKLKSILAELDALNAKNKALIDERARLQSDLNNLINVVVPNLTNQRDAAQAKIDKATAEIADLNSQIAAKQAELVQAQAIAKAAYDRYAPLVPEHDRLLDLRRHDENRLATARSNLADIDGSIANDQQTIANLNAEANSLQGQLPNAQADVQNGQNGLAQANQAYNSFDPREAARRFFWEDPRRPQVEQQVQQLQGQYQAYQNQVQQALGAVQAYQNAYNNAVNALNQCRAGRGPMAKANFLGRFLADGPSGGLGGAPGPGFGGPGGGSGFTCPPGMTCPAPGTGHNCPPEVPNCDAGEGNPPQPPRPPAAPNCSAQEAQVAQAQQQLAAAQGQLNQAQANLNNTGAALQNAQSQMEQIRNEAEWRAQGIQRDLANRVAQWQQYLQQAQNTLAGIQNRLSNIIQFELPRAQNDLAANENRRPGAVNEVAAAEQALATSTANFNNYLAATNYLAIEAEMQRTAGVVTQIQNTIAGFQAGVRSRQQLIVQQTNLRDSLNRQIAENNAVIAKKQARLAEVNAALALYDQQKAEIQARIDVAAADLKVFSDQYAASLK